MSAAIAGRVGATPVREYARAHQVGDVLTARVFLEWLRALGVSSLGARCEGGVVDIVWNDPAGVRVDVADFPSWVNDRLAVAR